MVCASDHSNMIMSIRVFPERRRAAPETCPAAALHSALLRLSPVSSAMNLTVYIMTSWCHSVSLERSSCTLILRFTADVSEGRFSPTVISSCAGTISAMHMACYPSEKNTTAVALIKCLFCIQSKNN